MSTVARSDIPGVRLRVLLPEEIVKTYEIEAERRGVEIETVLSERLVEAAAYTAAKPLYFNDSERQELEHVLGKNIATVKEALVQLRNLTSVRIQGLKIGLKLPLLTRLKSRCVGVKWEDFVERIVIEDLERYVGMR